MTPPAEPARAHAHAHDDDDNKRHKRDGGSLTLQRTFSGGDAGGVFGGDGGVLGNSRSRPDGWCERLDIAREEGADSSDVEKALQDEAEEEEAADKWEVRWEDGDTDNPRNMKKWEKWVCTYVVSSASLCV